MISLWGSVAHANAATNAAVSSGQVASVGWGGAASGEPHFPRAPKSRTETLSRSTSPRLRFVALGPPWL